MVELNYLGPALGAILGLKDYFLVASKKISKRLEGRYFEYDLSNDSGMGKFHSELLGEAYSGWEPGMYRYGKSIPKIPKLRPGSIIKFRNMGLSRWVPLFPGFMSTELGFEACLIFDEIIQSVSPPSEAEIQKFSHLFALGTSNVRLGNDGSNYLLGGSNYEVANGIPILVSVDLFNDLLSEHICDHGYVGVDLEGTLIELPRGWNAILNSYLPPITDSIRKSGIPPSRLAVQVNSVRHVRTHANMYGMAWTISESKAKQTYNAIEFGIDAIDEDLSEVIEEISDGIKKRKEIALTNFDEIKNWFPKTAKWGPSAHGGLKKY
ncbi:MAG: hypothetical protein JSV56_11885 [Methanomassiliicoccales archaeon]|nr:MAG: hypothetical protein JSV56_11885 [Methanomassiliicoccales archaeon]